MNIKIKVLLSLPPGQGGAVVQRRCAHVPAPCMETEAALSHQKADPHVPVVRGMEIGVAGAGGPCPQVLGCSGDQREPRRGICSIMSWTRVVDAERGTKLPPVLDQTPLCVWCPDAVPGWVSPPEHISVLLRAGFAAPQGRRGVMEGR